VSPFVTFPGTDPDLALQKNPGLYIIRIIVVCPDFSISIEGLVFQAEVL